MNDRGKNIVLIGFMGSGKTSVGLKLSYRLRMPVEDTDKLIEKRQGVTVSEIFANEGEEAFRRMETALLEELSQRPYERILSVGGGTPVREENRILLKKCGTVIYLRAKAETIYGRLKGDTTRPLLQCENPLERIRELLAARNDAYEMSADVVVDVDGLSIEEILERIVGVLQCETRGEKSTSFIINSESAGGDSRNKGEECRKMKILVINGPNINFLGIREKSVYGTQDYQYLLGLIEQKAKDTGNDITVFQSNHEGEIIDRIQEAYFDGTEGIVINPGAYTHYSYAIRDALASITVPKVEIHISDITKREEFRKVSVTREVCDHQIYGQGLDGYLQAIDYILQRKSS